MSVLDATVPNMGSFTPNQPARRPHWKTELEQAQHRADSVKSLAWSLHRVILDPTTDLSDLSTNFFHDELRECNKDPDDFLAQDLDEEIATARVCAQLLPSICTALRDPQPCPWRPRGWNMTTERYMSHTVGWAIERLEELFPREAEGWTPDVQSGIRDLARALCREHRTKLSARLETMARFAAARAVAPKSDTETDSSNDGSPEVSPRVTEPTRTRPRDESDEDEDEANFMHKRQRIVE